MQEPLRAGRFADIARLAVGIESRTHLLCSFEKMALRDAVRQRDVLSFSFLVQSTAAVRGARRLPTQIPDPRRHLVRYYGAYASRTRGARRARQAAAAAAAGAAAAADAAGAEGAAATVAGPGRRALPTAAASTVPPGGSAPPASPSRANGARLLRRIFEVDPLLCPRCGGGLAVVAVLTDPKVVDRILRHLAERGLPTSVHARAPPAGPAHPSAA